MLIPDEDSDEDITLRIDKSLMQSDSNDIFGIGQDTNIAPEDMSTLAMEEYDQDDIGGMGAHNTAASDCLDDNNKNIEKKEMEEDLLVQFD